MSLFTCIPESIKLKGHFSIFEVMNWCSARLQESPAASVSGDLEVYGQSCSANTLDFTHLAGASVGWGT